MRDQTGSPIIVKGSSAFECSEKMWETIKDLKRKTAERLHLPVDQEPKIGPAIDRMVVRMDGKDTPLVDWLIENRRYRDLNNILTGNLDVKLTPKHGALIESALASTTHPSHRQELESLQRRTPKIAEDPPKPAPLAKPETVLERLAAVRTKIAAAQQQKAPPPAISVPASGGFAYAGNKTRMNIAAAKRKKAEAAAAQQPVETTTPFPISRDGIAGEKYKREEVTAQENQENADINKAVAQTGMEERSDRSDTPDKRPRAGADAGNIGRKRAGANADISGRPVLTRPRANAFVSDLAALPHKKTSSNKGRGA